MNIFRLAGDVSHLVAIIILLLKIWKSKSCAGISGKSQVLFALVFTTRYLDLFTVYISAYNTVMKVVFLALSYATVYMIYMRFRSTFDSENDSFRLEFLLVPVIGLSFLENYAFTPMEILWTFSIFLEAVAIMPQLFMITKTGEAESITTHYLFFLGLYRALYIGNWIWRYHTEDFFDQIAVVSGVVQTIFYCDFFYLYVTKDELENYLSKSTHDHRASWKGKNVLANACVRPMFPSRPPPGACYVLLQTNTSLSCKYIEQKKDCPNGITIITV